ncbi:hypothetical protein HDU87_002373 [Geranomyces variabilis]|uniref:Uncharacterized protein n=1 Tax=Geranomyces variabilis TaxID=109894 RepID=A0AAD5TNE3_9FUNG|nr:hypothetical protein HDU87_002373 [Geranomyces variabilis]
MQKSECQQTFRNQSALITHGRVHQANPENHSESVNTPSTAPHDRELDKLDEHARGNHAGQSLNGHKRQRISNESPSSSQNTTLPPTNCRDINNSGSGSDSSGSNPGSSSSAPSSSSSASFSRSCAPSPESVARARAAATVIPATTNFFPCPPAATSAAAAVPKPEQILAYRVFAASEIALRAITRALLIKQSTPVVSMPVKCSVRLTRMEMDMLCRELRTALEKKGWDVTTLELVGMEHGMRINFAAQPSKPCDRVLELCECVRVWNEWERERECA